MKSRENLREDGYMDSSGVILMVENDRRIANSNRRALEFRRFTVYTATTYSEAHGMVYDLQPDIILMEAALPDGDGFSFCKEISSTTAVSIVFLTAKSNLADELKGLTLGAYDYIKKPFNRDLMVTRVEAVMRRRKRSGFV